MNRRGFLKGLAATAAGLLIPADSLSRSQRGIAAETERRVWALDSTMLRPRTLYWGSFDKDRLGSNTDQRRVLVTLDAVYAPWANDPWFQREYLRAKRELEDAIIFKRDPLYADFVRQIHA